MDKSIYSNVNVTSVLILIVSLFSMYLQCIVRTRHQLPRKSYYTYTKAYKCTVRYRVKPLIRSVTP